MIVDGEDGRILHRRDVEFPRLVDENGERDLLQPADEMARPLVNAVKSTVGTVRHHRSLVDGVQHGVGLHYPANGILRHRGYFYGSHTFHLRRFLFGATGNQQAADNE